MIAQHRMLEVVLANEGADFWEMKYNIFYSWQSDLDSALTRNIIEECLKKAAKSIHNDESANVEPVVDRDTLGSSGAAGIAETIFKKISECDVFVCDVSFINGIGIPPNGIFRTISLKVATFLNKNYFKEHRLTPNPNVLAELGFAAAKIGWGKIILVMNSDYGPVELLPFDLRCRRVVKFSLSSREERKEIRPKLREDLESALRSTLNDIIEPIHWPGVSSPRWFGRWEIPQRPTESHLLFIQEVGVNGFTFDMSLVDGARTGNICGYAKFVGPEMAFARIEHPHGDLPCEIKFRRDGRKITIEQGDGCACFMGMGACFDGEYECKRDLLFDYGALNEIELQRLYIITGQYFIKLQECFQEIHENSDANSPVRVFFGGVKGLYTIMEAVVVKSDSGHMWAAFIDDDVVRYFTTHSEFKDNLPSTIDTWREKFRDKQIIFENNVRIFSEIM